jgi:hypothetical protein
MRSRIFLAPFLLVVLFCAVAQAHAAQGLAGHVDQISFSPNKKLKAICSREVRDGDEYSTVTIQMADGTPLDEIVKSDSDWSKRHVCKSAWTPDSKFFVFSENDQFKYSSPSFDACFYSVEKAQCFSLEYFLREDSVADENFSLKAPDLITINASSDAQGDANKKKATFAKSIKLSSLSNEESIVSPDKKLRGVFTRRAAYVSSGNGDDGSDLRIEASSGGVLLTTMDVAATYQWFWTPDSKYFIVASVHVNGHFPWHGHVYVYSAQDNVLQELPGSIGNILSGEDITVTPPDMLNVMIQNGSTANPPLAKTIKLSDFSECEAKPSASQLAAKKQAGR